MIVGIIDGDGSITFKHNKETVFIRITAHEVWTDFYLSLFNFLNIPITVIKDTRFPAISVCIQNKKLIFDLYDEISKLNLPLLKRKWDRIKNLPRNFFASKIVQQFDLDGNLIAKYDSIKIAAVETNSSETGICKCCKGKLRKCNNFIWKYGS